ncbi:MAG: hypothetical protein WDO16_00485 [Bacteroidota bacterium]
MKTESTQNLLPLHLMVNRISTSSLPAAIRKHSFIVNDIPADIQVHTDENMLATVFGSLLNTVINHTENCCIRISAKLFGKVVLINLKESHRVSSHAFTGSIRQIQQLAERIGGTVSISSDRTNATTLLLSFTNNLSVAA